MDIDKLIKSRRSIRTYKDKVPDDNDIKKVIEAAIWAPSGLNNQPWKFHIVDKDKKNGLAQFTKYEDIIKNAPIALCVYLDNSATYNREKDILSVGAAIQNILLQAHAIGLGTCWLGEILNKKDEIAGFLKTEPDYELMAVITIGYPSGNIVKGKRKDFSSFLI